MKMIKNHRKKKKDFFCVLYHSTKKEKRLVLKKRNHLQKEKKKTLPQIPKLEEGMKVTLKKKEESDFKRERDEWRG